VVTKPSKRAIPAKVQPAARYLKPAAVHLVAGWAQEENQSSVRRWCRTYDPATLQQQQQQQQQQHTAECLNVCEASTLLEVIAEASWVPSVSWRI